jgi:hypothetical protein
MKPCYTLLAILFAVSVAARAQVEPAVPDAAALLAGGTFHYDVRYSQTAQFYGGAEGDLQRSVVSGETTYSGVKETHPFNLTYSGGDMWAISGTSEGAGVFQHLLVSQGFLGRKWALTVSDNVSYLPQAATTGFSGIPGVGSLPGAPGEPAQPILTLNTRSISNAVNPDYTYHLDYATKLSIGGGYGILRFPDGNGLEVNSMQAAPQVERRLDARNSLTAQYAYSRFTYTLYTFSMQTQSALFGYQRTWNRRFKTTFALGPEWVSSSNSAAIPSSTNLTANANASYEARSMTVTVAYSQASTGGAGVTTEPGTHIQDVNGAFSREFVRNFTLTGTGAYMRTVGLNNTGAINNAINGAINAVFGGVAATRQLGRYISIFANYTAIKQSSGAALPANAISGVSQVVTFGIGYTPREIHLKK